MRTKLAAAMGVALAFGAAPAMAAVVITAGSPGTTGVTGLYATAIAEASATLTPTMLANILDVPDRAAVGMGGGVFLTYDLEAYRLVDGVGQDFNVYEDYGAGHGAEFGELGVSVSNDLVNFFSVKLTESAAVDLAGDEDHAGANANFRRSYDVGAAVLASGESGFRYIRLQGIGDSNGHDLDAMGVANFTAAPTGGIPEPGAWALMILGFGGAGAMIRRRRALA